MGSHTTIKDVAKKAGVSITTVSFVLNNRPDVVISDAVQKKVRKIAEELDYHPSAMAAGLAGRRTRNLGVVFYQEDNVISNQFYSFVIDGIVRETVEKGFNLFFSYVEASYKGYQSLPKIVREKNVDGVLLIGRTESRMVRDIKGRGIPAVAIDNYPALRGVDTVQMDNKRGGQIATEHLIQLGHRHTGFLTIPAGRPSVEEREEGWRMAFEKNGLKPAEDLVFRCDALTFQAGYEKTRDLLQRNKKITALFCANDEMAAGALRAAHETGWKVPGDLSVVGFDNVTMSNYVDPPLTTVSAAKEYMGKSAAARLMELVENKELSPIRQEVPVELILRESTAKPSKG